MAIVDPTAEMHSIVIYIRQKGGYRTDHLAESDKCPDGIGQFKYQKYE